MRVDAGQVNRGTMMPGPLRALGLTLVTAVMSMVGVPALAQVDRTLARGELLVDVPKSDPLRQAALKVEEIINKRVDVIASFEPVCLASILENGKGYKPRPAALPDVLEV